MSVYTKTGDKGRTSLYQGKRISKANLRIEAIGNVDELNSVLGFVLSSLKEKGLREELSKIQSDLFEIGALLASPSSSSKLNKRAGEIEKKIDELDKKLLELNNFILPGGGVSGSSLHFARTVARRAERRIVELSEQDKVQDEILIYMNRLSDLLFMFARFLNFKEKKKEKIWKSR